MQDHELTKIIEAASSDDITKLLAFYAITWCSLNNKHFVMSAGCGRGTMKVYYSDIETPESGGFVFLDYSLTGLREKDIEARKTMTNTLDITSLQIKVEKLEMEKAEMLEALEELTFLYCRLIDDGSEVREPLEMIRAKAIILKERGKS